MEIFNNILKYHAVDHDDNLVSEYSDFITFLGDDIPLDIYAKLISEAFDNLFCAFINPNEVKELITNIYNNDSKERVINFLIENEEYRLEFENKLKSPSNCLYFSEGYNDPSKYDITFLELFSLGTKLFTKKFIKNLNKPTDELARNNVIFDYIK